MPVKRAWSMMVNTEAGAIPVNVRSVSSSNVDWVGWPATGQPVMIVQFQGGSRYAYIGVSRQRAVAAAMHKSTGKYLNERIKPHFKVAKIR